MSVFLCSQQMPGTLEPLESFRAGLFPQRTEGVLEAWPFQMRLLTAGEGRELESELIINGQRFIQLRLHDGTSINP